MSNKTLNYYLPFMRTGMAARVGAKSLDSKRSTIPVTVDLKSTTDAGTVPSNINIALYGPGDVLGFSNRIVVKTQPKEHIRNFGPSLIPFIEFAEPDFLWRYSSKKGAQKYWVPWLSLVILMNQDGEDDGEFEELKREKPDLPARIKISDKANLPDLNQAWRWAHIHTNDRAGKNVEEIKTKVIKKSHQAVSRLLCPRRLTPNTSYTAFVVPTYRLGWEAAMGIDVNASETKRNDLTWDTPSKGKGQIMPYYFKWEFRTGTRGDFEYLIKQLEFKKLEGVGTKTVDASNPGYDLQNQNNKEIEFEGALKSTDTKYEKWGYDAGAANPTQKKLSKVLNARVTTENGEEIIRVVPPIYGSRFLESDKSHTYKIIPSKQTWISELNLDFRHRYAAGLGVQFVKENQESLMKAAWEQLREIKKVNRVLNVGKFGRAVSNCLYKRLEGLKGENLLQLGLSMHTNISASTSLDDNLKNTPKTRGVTGTQTKTSIFSQLSNSPITSNMGQLKVKKFLVRKYEGESSKAANKLQVNRRSFIPVLESEIISKTFTPGTIKPKDTGTNKTKTKIIKDKIGTLGNDIMKSINPKFTIERRFANKIKNIRNAVEESQLIKPTPQVSARSVTKEKDELRPVIWHPEFHTPMYRYLRDMSQDYLMPGLENIPQNTVTLLTTNQRFIESYMLGLNHEFASELRWREYPTDMRGTYFRKFWDTTIYSADDLERKEFRETRFAKKLLRKLHTNYSSFFSGLNTSVKQYVALENIFKKNHTELANERGVTEEILREMAEHYEEAIEKWLLTREEDKDIQPIATWKENSKLGAHAVGNTSGQAANQMVLLIRGDILNKFPNMLVYLAEKKSSKPDYKKRIFPIFEANLPPDIEMLGFPIAASESKKYFLVFEEPMTEVQYGLDETDDAKTSDLESNVSWQHFSVNDGQYLNKTLPSNTISKGKWNNPSYIAKIFTQKSVRVAIPLSRFIS